MRFESAVGILERVGGVDVEEAAAVGAELLDRLLRGDRAARELGDGAAEGLQHALRDEQDRADDRDRQQDVEGRPHEVLPEVAQRRRRAAAGHDAADERDRDRDAGRGGDEVLHRQARHLAEVGERRLAAVVLPVRVGHERRGGVEREVPGAGVEVLWVERVQRLRAQDEEEHQPAGEREEDHAAGVGLPVLAARGVDAQQPVGEALEGSRDRVEERALAPEDAGHVAAEQRHHRDDERAEDRDLEEALGHGGLRTSRRAAARRRGRRRSARQTSRPMTFERSYAVEPFDEERQQREDADGEGDGEEIHDLIVRPAVKRP